MQDQPSSSLVIDGFSAAPLVEAAKLAALQAILLYLLGFGGFMVLLSALLPTVIVSVRWADPLMLDKADALVVVGWVALFLAPMIGIYALGPWIIHVALTMVGIVLGRVQLFQPRLQEDAIGVEAHLQRVRKEGTRRATGNADRAPSAAGLDPIAGFFGGGGGAPQPMDDPYENTKSVQFTPDDS